MNGNDIRNAYATLATSRAPVASKRELKPGEFPNTIGGMFQGLSFLILSILLPCILALPFVAIANFCLYVSQHWH